MPGTSLLLLLALRAHAQAPLDPTSRESLEKRLFLLERAADRGDCQQAIEAAAMIAKDFGEVPGARLGRAHALACESKWVEAWALVEEARADKYDTKAIEARIKPNVAFVELRVVVDGKPRGEDRFAPSARQDGEPVALVRLAPGVYRAVVGGGEPLVVTSAGGDPTLSAPPRQELNPKRGVSTEVRLEWKSIPIGALDVRVTVDGRPFSAGDALDVPRPVVELADGSTAPLDDAGLGAWRLAQVGAGPLRVRVPGGSLTDASSAAVEVKAKATATVTIDVRRVPMASLTRPAGLDAGIDLRVGDRVLGPAERVSVRAGDLPVTAAWRPAGASGPLTVTWSQTFGAGEGRVEVPWAHVVQDEQGRVVHRALHAPDEAQADLTGVRVALPGVGGDDLKVPLEGVFERVPGAVVKGTVTTSGHPVYAARGGRKRQVRRGLLMLGGGVGAAAGFGGWMALEAGKAGSAAAEARSLEVGDGQDAYDALVGEAEGATARANVALGAAALSAAAGAVGWGVFTFGPGPDVAKAAATPLLIATGGQ
jgi:hypothetical protein